MDICKTVKGTFGQPDQLMDSLESFMIITEQKSAHTITMRSSFMYFDESIANRPTEEGSMHGQTNGRTVSQTDGQTVRQTDRQTDTRTDEPSYSEDLSKHLKLMPLK